ncbi:MAG: hypothetical protein ACOC1O_01925 [bacterium]
MVGRIFETKKEFVAGFKGYTVPVGFKVKIIDTNNSTDSSLIFSWTYKLKVLNNVCDNFKKGDTPRVSKQTLNEYFKEITPNSIKKV